MDLASSAVGIVSLGIQVCQSLLEYYDGWKSYETDITTAYDSIADLCRTFTLLQESLGYGKLDQARAMRVQTCLDSCVGGLTTLQSELQELRSHSAPQGLRQKTRAELQKLYYPFKRSTLAKLREVVDDLREQVSLALHVLQLDLGINADRALDRIESTTQDTAANVQTLLTAQQADQFQKIVGWLSPPDPWINHDSARRHHEPHTGAWFLGSDRYRSWKSGQTRHLWVYGKAGCGKTILSSTVIEGLRSYCEKTPNSCLAIFYFSFSDGSKQSYEALLRSLVAQLCWNETGRSMLEQEYNRPNRSLPRPEALETILLSSIQQRDEVFLAVDALDECPNNDEARQNVLDCLERLSEKASNLKIFVTSRDLSDIRERMVSLGVELLSISTSSVDADIRTYVENELSRDRTLKQLDKTTKKLVKDTFAQKSDGMFRWAFCQLQVLKKLRSMTPRYVEQALTLLPSSLDATYERMLRGIEEMYRPEALNFLRWLAFQLRPLTFGELAEAGVIDPSGAGTVDYRNRSTPEGVLGILQGLVTVDWVPDDKKKDEGKDELSSYSAAGSSDLEADSAHRLSERARVRLAHFSVKEYLLSDRIRESKAKDFHLQEGREHRHITQGCLTYLMHYSGSDMKTRTKQDLSSFQLLWYAAKYWYRHSQLQDIADVDREVRFLGSKDFLRDWTLIHAPDTMWLAPFEGLDYDERGLYYASYLGLLAATVRLLDDGADVNARGGFWGNALVAASYRGHQAVVELLIKRGANVNAQGRFGNALQRASQYGEGKMVELLIDRGADVDAPGPFGNALQMASREGHEHTVRLLISRGADIDAPGPLGNALQVASEEGHENVVRLLIDRGADINAPGPIGNALQVASEKGQEKVVELLIDRGADIDAPGPYGTALQMASGTRTWFGRL